MPLVDDLQISMTCADAACAPMTSTPAPTRTRRTAQRRIPLVIPLMCSPPLAPPYLPLGTVGRRLLIAVSRLCDSPGPVPSPAAGEHGARPNDEAPGLPGASCASSVLRTDGLYPWCGLRIERPVVVGHDVDARTRVERD